MRILKKLALLLLAVSMVAGLAACSAGQASDAPDGMSNATVYGADFRLYVPSGWNPNLVYGISGAYFTASTQSTVSAVKYEITADMTAAMEAASVREGSARLDWFWQNACCTAVEELAQGGSFSVVAADSESPLLDGLQARRHHTQATVQGKLLHFVHVVAERNAAFYVITFTVADDLYSSLLSSLQTVIENFDFADEPYDSGFYQRALDENAEAPEGMKLVSNDDVAYRFYVPTAWNSNRHNGIFSAYVESDRSNVSVVPYMPNVESMSVAEYFAECEKMMQSLPENNYQKDETEEKVDLGGRQATVYTYRLTVGGHEYHYMQVIAARGSMLYSLTYTAPDAESFAAHLADVEAMIEAFAFR